MKTAVGVIGVTSVETVDEKSITRSDASKAGYDSVASLMTAVNKVKAGKVYKVKVKYLSEDPRIELRENTGLSNEETGKIIAKLHRLDKTRGPWVLKTLQLIKRFPERRAGDLADIMKMDKLDFKLNVRKLKNLGLTISHEIGYSISPLGDVVIDQLRKSSQAASI
ncbi:MAG: hypothetical protein WDO14_15590 [Bacteroidota bacterium]